MIYLTHRNKHRELGKIKETKEYLPNKRTRQNLTKGKADKQFTRKRVQSNSQKHAHQTQEKNG